MQNIRQREEKIKAKKKQTKFRDFLMEICGWYPIVFYKNNGLLSKFPDTGRKDNLVSFNDFNKIRDSLVDNGWDYDVSGLFFEQLSSFFKVTPYPAVVIYAGGENCEYADAVLNAKNVYLSLGVISDCENILYSILVKNNCSNILGCNWIVKSNNIYLSNGIVDSFNVFYSSYINNCNNVWFSTDLNGCYECIRCKTLENQSYCIDNKGYSKEEYLQKKEGLLKEKNNYHNWFDNMEPYASNIGSKNVKGGNCMLSEDIVDGYGLNQVSTGRNVINVGGEGISKNIYDVYGATPPCEEAYGVFGVGVGASNIYNSAYTTASTNIYYSYFMESSSYCLGCVGLRNKSYCILNKQYNKEDRFKLVNKIFEKMDKDGSFGNFFPPTMNPFYFNDTVAYLMDDTFTKEEVTNKGYLRRDEKIKVDIPEGSETVKFTELDQYQGFDSNGVREINPEILKKVIIDEKGNYYRIVKMEYDFLMKHGLPLPEIHWLDRIKLGFRFK